MNYCTWQSTQIFINLIFHHFHDVHIKIQFSRIIFNLPRTIRLNHFSSHHIKPLSNSLLIVEDSNVGYHYDRVKRKFFLGVNRFIISDQSNLKLFWDFLNVLFKFNADFDALSSRSSCVWYFSLPYSLSDRKISFTKIQCVRLASSTSSSLSYRNIFINLCSLLLTCAGSEINRFPY